MPYTPPLIQTSAQLAAQLSDETGSGLAVFGTGPTITLANGSGLPVSGITASTSTALGVGSIELGAASDTTIARSGAGAVTVEGVQVILSGAALGTPSSGTLSNCSALPVSGITASTSTALGVGSIELGHASDTTLARSGAGAVTVEGVQVILSGAALGTPASGTLTNCTALPVSGITASTSTALGVGSVELGHASDTTIARSGAGAITVEGTQVILSGAALGTPASGTLTNCSSLPVSGITASTSTALGVGSIELGHASDTTIARVSSGVISVEGVTVDTISAANTLTNKTLTSPTLTTPVLGTPSSGTLTSCTGTADGLTAGDVTRNHAVYAAASPPTVDVGEFTIVKTGVDLKTAATTTIFTVPTSRTFICSYASVFVTSVTTGGAGTQTFKIQEGGGTAMTPATVSGSGTPVANSSYYQQPGTAGGGLYKAAAAGVTVQVVIATSHAGSTAVSGSVFVTGKYVI